MSKTCQLLLLLLIFSPLHPSSTTPSSPSSLSYSVLGEDESPASGHFCNGTAIPHPFGVPGFTKPPPLPGFSVTCQQSNTLLQSSSPRLSLSPALSLPILDFNIPAASLRVALGPTAWRCNRGLDEQPADFPDLTDSPFTYSVTRNVFAVVGCDSFVTLRSGGATRSCVSFCEGAESVVDGACSGVGCCQASIPERMKSLGVEFRSIRNMTGAVVNGTPCGVAFVMEREGFRFSAGYLEFGEASRSPRAVVLDWAVGEKSCEEVRRIGGEFVCGEKAVCSDSSNGVGYLCSCGVGYEGNPYLPNGCQGIHTQLLLR